MIAIFPKSGVCQEQQKGCLLTNRTSEFYGLDPSFPRDQFLTRADGDSKSKTMYFVSKAVKELLSLKDVHRRLNIVNTGARCFVRQQNSGEEGEMAYRLACEGLPLLDRVLSGRRRVLLSSANDLKTLLTEAYPKIEKFEAPTAARLDAIG